MRFFSRAQLVKFQLAVALFRAEFIFRSVRKTDRCRQKLIGANESDEKVNSRGYLYKRSLFGNILDKKLLFLMLYTNTTWQGFVRIIWRER